MGEWSSVWVEGKPRCGHSRRVGQRRESGQEAGLLGRGSSASSVAAKASSPLVSVGTQASGLWLSKINRRKQIEIDSRMWVSNRTPSLAAERRTVSVSLSPLTPRRRHLPLSLEVAPFREAGRRGSRFRGPALCRWSPTGPSGRCHKAPSPPCTRELGSGYGIRGGSVLEHLQLPACPRKLQDVTFLMLIRI